MRPQPAPSLTADPVPLPRTLADILHLEVKALEAIGCDPNDLMPGALACAVSYIAARRGPKFAAEMCDRAAAELRGALHA
ncbi:MAG: hypothetical protein ACK46Q_03775 [Hyphomonas sp.]